MANFFIDRPILPGAGNLLCLTGTGDFFIAR